MLFGLLLNIANFLGDLLKGVFVSAVLHLEVCRKCEDPEKLVASGLGSNSPCCLLADAA